MSLSCFLDADRVAVFSAWETLPHERLSPRSDTVGRRLAVLRRLTHPDAGDPVSGRLDVVVAPVLSVLQPQVAGLGDFVPVELKVGDEIELDAAVGALANAAYIRTDLVEKRGDFAVCGGILDVFRPTEEHPLRVEFWGDTVEEVRYFKVADQRSSRSRNIGCGRCRRHRGEKLVRRHQHVFSYTTAPTAAHGESNWDVTKAAEKGRPSAVEGVPLAQPALSLAAKLMSRAATANVAVDLVESEDAGERLFVLVAEARAAGVDRRLRCG